MATKKGMHMYRKTSLVVGVVYLAGFVVGLVGTGLVQSILGTPDQLSAVPAHRLILTIGALLWLLACAGDAAHGVLMFPVLKPHSERLAIGYLAARIIDAVFLTVPVLFILLQIPLANEYLKAPHSDTFSLQALSTVFTQANLYADNLSWIALGLAGVMLNFLFYRTKLLPRWIAIWGLVGYTILVCGMVAQIMGIDLGLISELPGGLWEVFVGGWLIVRGFNASAFASPANRSIQSTESVIAHS